jgi:hypothetical protein
LEAGQILKGDPQGSVEVFAEGFKSPWSVGLDRYHRLYVVDQGRGIYKISGLAWSQEILIERLEDIIGEFDLGTIDQVASLISVRMDIRSSLKAKLESARDSLEKSHVGPALNILEAFQNELAAQTGKEIPLELAEKWRKAVNKIIAVLLDL